MTLSTACTTKTQLMPRHTAFAPHTRAPRLVRLRATDKPDAPPSTPPPQQQEPETMSVREALKAAQQRQQAAQRQQQGGSGPTGRSADSTDWISSQLTRRFGIAGGLAWLGFLTFGAVSEQIKTRLEVASEEANRKEIQGAKEVVLPSGVRYTDVIVGGGQRPQRGDLVAAQLRIAIDGATVLDTARKGRPVAFLYGSRPSGGVTKGLEEGIASMKAGGTRTVVVPPAQAYGDEGAILTPNPKKPDDTVRIPPGATLVYTVELTRVSIAPS